MKFGVSYYPELVDEAEWRTDLQNMRRAHLRIIRMLEFAWACLEPREGEYDFAWLDRFLDLAHEMGFEVVLCTPTATPPAWLTTQYPEMLIELRDGKRRHPGGRRDVDTDNEVFRYFACQIAGRLGERYGRHPAVIGWQIDNELLGPEGEPPECHTRATTFRFRQYLKQVHGDLKTLNQRWGTRFWSQQYSDWGEITTPLNPRSTMGQVLDFSRYFSQSQKVFLRLQYEAMRETVSPEQWISHNSTAVFDRGLDHADWAQEMDVAGWDAYPCAAGRPYPEAFAALAHDWFRTARRKPFWVFETSALDGRITPAFLAEMKAHGARAVLFWHWRNHRANAEQGNNAFCDYAGRPWEDRIRFMDELVARPEMQGDLPAVLPQRRAALMFCPDAVRPRLTPDPYIQRGQAKAVSYLRVLIETYRVLWQMGIAVDVVGPMDPLDGYDLLVMPSARLLSREAGESISRFVENGGTLLGVAKTAHQDQWGAYYPRLADPLAEVLGFSIRRDIGVTDDVTVRLESGRVCSCLAYAERLENPAGEVLARFAGGGIDGEVAALTRRFGRGHVFYAAGCSADLIQHLAALAARQAKLPFAESPVDDLALLPDLHEDRYWLFNHTSAPVQAAGQVVLPGDFRVVESLELPDGARKARDLVALT
jgi:beta-galactosidase